VGLQELGDGGVLLRQALRRAGHADLGEPGAHRDLPGDERGPAGRAALLGVVVGEHQAFLGQAVDVRGLVAHHPVVDGADVPVADVVSPDDEDVRLLRFRLRRTADQDQCGEDEDRNRRE
jgi:hypothetical protein